MNSESKSLGQVAYEAAHSRVPCTEPYHERKWEDAADGVRRTIQGNYKGVETFTCPILSTGHLPGRTAGALNEGALQGVMAACYTLGEYGWLVYTNDPGMLEANLGRHPELRNILDWACANGHRYVMFDRDGDTYPEMFPVFDW